MAALLPQTRYVQTPDGRRLRVEVAGEGQNVVLAMVGTPNAGRLYEGWVRDADDRGLTLVAYDRPGYGESSRQPGRSVADCAADVRVICQELGVSRCAAWGFSGGGPHALACGALLDSLVVAVATIGSPAPIDAPGFDFVANMSEGFRQDHELFLSDRAEWEREGEAQRDALLRWSLEEFVEDWSTGKSAGDQAVLRREFGAWLHRAAQAAVAPGAEGWTDDDIAILRSPWGFDVRSLAVPVKIWHGVDDQFASVEHGRWLARNIPGAEAELRDGDGHLNVAAYRIGEVHGWLAEHF
jgi:pimeloyl-ACP methyl ester carboxylesterase